MKLRLHCAGFALLSGFLFVSCAAPELESSNTIRVSSLPAQNLQMAQEYQKMIPIYDEAVQQGVIDSGFYLQQREIIKQAVQDQFDMYEGGIREQMLGCHSYGNEEGLGYLFFEPEGTGKSMPYARVTHK